MSMCAGASSGVPLVLLGQASLVPGRPRPLSEDPELGAATPGGASVRSLSGQLEPAPAGMSRWPRFDRYGRALARVTTLAAPRERVAGDVVTGLYVASHTSCFETNALFHRGLLEKGARLASPLLFPYTLPGAAASEVAMHLGLFGPYAVFPGGPTAALASVLAAADLLAGGPPGRLLVASADVLGPATWRSFAEHDLVPDPSAPPLAEAACALWLGTRTAGHAGLHLAIEGALGPAPRDTAASAAIVREALGRAGVGASGVTQILTATVDPALRLHELGACAELVPHVTPIQLVWRLGSSGASLGLLALAAALEEAGPALVVASEASGAVAIVVEHGGA